MRLRSTRTRLGPAVTAVLAVTALGAGTLTTAPAFAAAPVAAPAEAGEATGLPVFPEGSELGGVGTTGFLSYSFGRDGTRKLLWTPYDGGSPIPLQEPEDGGWTLGAGDVLVLGDASWSADMRAITLRNMATPSAPGVDIDLGALDAKFVAVLSPTSVLAHVKKGDGPAELRIVTRNGADTTSRPVSGLPADATDLFGSLAHDGSVLVGYETGPADLRTGGRALIDVAAGSVTKTYASRESGYGYGGLSFSGSHVTWFGYESGTGDFITSVDRSTGEAKRTVLGSHLDEWYHVLVGDWLVYGNPSTPARAVSLTSGETRDLGVTASTASDVADGRPVLKGSRAADGDGLFRITAAEDGTPTVTKAADTAELVIPLTIQQVHVPEAVDLDKSGGKVTLGWTLSDRDATLDVTLTHIATGREFRTRVPAPATGTRFSFDWDGVVDDADAPNGKYAVEAEATPLDGAGEPAYQGWFMNLGRTYNPHDLNDNGSTDVLARDASGQLWRDDLRDRPDYGQVNVAGRTRVGHGWGVYPQIEAVGNAGGAAHGDVMAVDGAGVQWLYLGKGDGTLAPRVRVGQGWQIYNKIAAGSDLDGDSRPDLVATDNAGDLWFYKGTGDYAKPYAPRVRVGGGWQVYNHLTAVGDIAGASAGDLVARGKDGVLWLYLGKGDGTFAPRIRIGGGWNAFSQLVGAGDLDNDGRPDLIAYGPGGTTYYRSTGVNAAPFSPQRTMLYAGEGNAFTHVS
ncbi:FG-GAP repeat domain-containing protein [Streptomyces sp. NPDC017254]|uniref:FG-GAP repeat domain-containing protein n=1 Tax=unclassified Streptomyces TaxID=2593676 RepID=UPI003791D37C